MLMSSMENGEIQVKFAMKQAALDECVEIIGAVVALDIARKVELRPPLTEGRFSPIGCDCPDSTVRMNFEVREALRQVLSVVASGYEGICNLDYLV